MKLRLPLCLALFTLLPAAAQAEMAGDWTGVLDFPSRTLHIVLHISGPDNDLKATHDQPGSEHLRAFRFFHHVFGHHASVCI